MTGDFRNLATFFMELEPAAAALDIVAFHFQRQHDPDARERLGHDPEEDFVAMSDFGNTPRKEDFSDFL